MKVKNYDGVNFSPSTIQHRIRSLHFRCRSIDFNDNNLLSVYLDVKTIASSAISKIFMLKYKVSISAKVNFGKSRHFISISYIRT